MNTRYKANLALFLSVLGLTLSFSFLENGFWGGLLYHGFLAAVIGGLADWYAVTAIFHKPFGIGWQTDILRRNRSRIIRELVDFIGRELLTPSNIMAVWRKENLASLFTVYLLEQGGKKRIIETADALLLKMVDEIDMTTIAVETSKIVKNFVNSLRLEQSVTSVEKGLPNAENIECLAVAFVHLGEKILFSMEFQKLLKCNIIACRNGYIGNSDSRAMMFQLSSLTDDRLLEMLSQKLEGLLDDLSHADSVAGNRLREYLRACLSDFFVKEDWGKMVAAKISKKIDLLPFETIAHEWLRESLYGNRRNSPWRTALLNFWATKVDEFVANEEWKSRFDSWLKDWLEKQLMTHHQLLIGMIDSRLTKISDDGIIKLIEDKVANDLQIIRINGALIGSLTGMLLYALAFLLTEVSGL